MSDPSQNPAEEATTEPSEPQPQPQLHGYPLSQRGGQVSVHTARDGYLALATALKDDGFEVCIGVTGVDYLTHPGRELPEGIHAERFEVVVELLSITQHRRLRIRCQVPGDDPVVPTLFDLWTGAEAHEREVFDLFGIRFENHPDLTRILMPEDWEGHPLRKDYDVGRVPVQFKET